MEENELSRPPTVDDFRRALSRMVLSPNQKALLEAHYWAPEHTITMAALAKAVGSPGTQGVECQYQRLATRIGEALSWKGCIRTFDILGISIPSGERGDAEWLLVMRPELARAVALQKCQEATQEEAQRPPPAMRLSLTDGAKGSDVVFWRISETWANP